MTVITLEYDKTLVGYEKIDSLTEPTEPVERTYYMRVYEKCPVCRGSGYLRFKSVEYFGKCLRCRGEGYANVYIPLAEWAAQTRERVDVDPGMPGAHTVTYAPDNVTHAPDNVTHAPDNVSVPVPSIPRNPRPVIDSVVTKGCL